MTRPFPPAALRRLAPTLLAAGLFAALPVAAQTHAPPAVELHLPAGPLQASLNALARQSGIQLLFAADSVDGRSAPALQGRYAPREALQRLLQGHDLTLKERAPGVFVVSALASAAPANASAPARPATKANPTSLARSPFRPPPRACRRARRPCPTPSPC